MTFPALLVGLVDFCRRNALFVMLAAAILVVFSGWYAAGHLGITTDTDEMFAASLPWRQRAEMFKKLFPQFQDLLVAVIDAKEPEEADATAAALAKALADGPRAFPRASGVPTLRRSSSRKGCLFLDTPQLESLIERMIDAQPFLGELAKDPSARGLFDALSLLGTGVEQGQVNLAPYQHGPGGLSRGDGERARRASAPAVLGPAARRRARRSRRPLQIRPGAAQARPHQLCNRAGRRHRRSATPRASSNSSNRATPGCASPATWRSPTRSSRRSPRAR